MKYLRLSLLIAFVSTVVSTVHADVIYTYSGNDFTTFFSASCPSVCAISGHFVLPNALAPNLSTLTTIMPSSFSFTDGAVTIDSANSAPGPFGSTYFGVTTDSLGSITGWNNQYFSAMDFMFSSTNPPGCSGCTVTDQSGDFASTYFAENLNNPGNWTSTNTPEPSAMSLFAIGLFGFVPFLRRFLAAFVATRLRQ